MTNKNKSEFEDVNLEEGCKQLMKFLSKKFESKNKEKWYRLCVNFKHNNDESIIMTAPEIYLQE